MNAYVTPQPVVDGWSAELDLAFARRGDCTVLVRNRHVGPLRVQRPFYPESGGQCHVYILHPPGGIVAGDSLSIQAQLDVGAHGLLTTPSAGRVYKSNRQRLPQSQRVQLQVADAAFCEWLPQENILFDAAEARNRTQIELSGSARFVGWEITCLGRPASQDWFASGSLQQTLALYREGVPLLLERTHFAGGSDLLEAPWGLQGYTAVGTLLITAGETALLQELKTLCGAACGADLQVAATRLPELLVVRGLAHNAAPLRNFFIACWRLARRHLLQVDAVAPRIWFT